MVWKGRIECILICTHMIENGKRIVIVGGVAGGASCAARARRLCEKCTIEIFEKSPFVSFANCGLPYYVGNVITEEKNLLVATPQRFHDYFNIKVHTEHEVTAIDPAAREIEVCDLKTGVRRSEPYDALVMATGANAIRPPLPGIDLPGVRILRTIPDSRRMRAAVEKAGSAVVVGGGFIGLEMAENLVRRNISVTIIEAAPQVMTPLDPEMAIRVAQQLKENGVEVRVNCAVESFAESKGGGLEVHVSTGESLRADLAVLAIGVKPAAELAVTAGIDTGSSGGIHVDDSMRTSDPNIWAVGDVVETTDIVTGTRRPLALAGPANRQGRVAAATIMRSFYPETCERRSGIRFRGVQATSVCGVFGMTVAMTGANERALQHAGIEDFERVYLHPGHHVGYYPGARPIHLKLIYSTTDGRILGAQAVGEAGVERRIDVIAMAMQMGGTVFDLEEAELCYAPQFGAAKDPVNLAGMIAANTLRGDFSPAAWEELNSSNAVVLDVRSPEEFRDGHIPGSVNIPLPDLRGRIDELSPAESEEWKHREVWLTCGVGQRAYYATRLLMQNGYNVKVLSGGMMTYETLVAARSQSAAP